MATDTADPHVAWDRDAAEARWHAGLPRVWQADHGYRALSRTHTCGTFHGGGASPADLRLAREG